MAIVVEKEEILEVVPADAEALQGFDPGRKKDYKYREARRLGKRRHQSPSSRLHIRGISMASPIRIYLGALICLVFLTTMFLSLLSPIYLLMTEGLDPMVIVVLALFVLSTLLYFFVSVPCRCRVCRVSLYSLRGFLRNRQAHRLPILGYTFATALHLVLFLWVRCPACGTSQKVFKSQD